MTTKSIEAGPEARVAIMNPDAVTEAKVFHGDVHYYYEDRMIILNDTTLVEVGKWTSEGAEHSSEDYQCTYYAAQLIGLKSEWIPYNVEGERKLFITAGRNEKGEILSFTEEQATKISEAINGVYSFAKVAAKSLVNV